jgi:hypothetical protein
LIRTFDLSPVSTSAICRAMSCARPAVTPMAHMAAIAAHLFTALQSRKGRLDTRWKFTLIITAGYYIVFSLGYEI